MVSSLKRLEFDMFLDDKYVHIETRMESILNIMIYGIKSLPITNKNLN
jgi:hypothetical protein